MEKLTTLQKLIELTTNGKIQWYIATDELFKTYNNDICIRLEVEDNATFTLKIDAKYYASTLDETYESDRIIDLYKLILPRAQQTVEDRFFEGLI